MECKKILFNNLVAEIGPIQSRVKEINEKPHYMVEVLKSGATRCQSIVKKVMDETKEKIGVKSDWF